MGELSMTDLDRIITELQTGPYPGYPEYRLSLGHTLRRNGVLQVPEGPWHIRYHRNRFHVPGHLLDIEIPSINHPSMDPGLYRRWQALGLELDQYNRPLHPDYQILLADREVGLPTGLGFFWHYGPNPRVSATVYRQQQAKQEPEVLLVQQKAGLRWELPGGFFNKHQPAEPEARQVIAAETGLDDIEGTSEIVVANHRPIGLRDTLHAWTSNNVILLHGDPDYLLEHKPHGGANTVTAEWFALHALSSMVHQRQLPALDFDYIELGLPRMQID